MFDSHSKDENGNLSSLSTAALLNFDTLHTLKNYIRSVHNNAYLMTLYFQLQFIKVHCTFNAMSAIKYLLKKETIFSKVAATFESYENLQKYYENLEKKRQLVKRRYDDKKESIKQYMKEKYVENRTSNIE